ncbi:hypothetical protein FD724_25715 [Nostoc sp. C057]|nr:hypothetical protein FD724_25715 [Nostoc sp. C057]
MLIRRSHLLIWRSHLLIQSKTINCVGWVEERNPTFSRICWVSVRSTQPTIIYNKVCDHLVNTEAR